VDFVPGIGKSSEKRRMITKAFAAFGEMKVISQPKETRGVVKKAPVKKTTSPKSRTKSSKAQPTAPKGITKKSQASRKLK
jgi:hypothetical protein